MTLANADVLLEMVACLPENGTFDGAEVTRGFNSFRHGDGARNRATTLLEMVRVANSSLQTDRVLQSVSVWLTAIFRVRYCWFCFVQEEEMGILWADTRTIPLSVAEVVRPLLNRAVRLSGDCLARRVVDRRQPISWCEALGDICPADEMAQRLGVRSVLAVPLVVGGQTKGALMLGSIDDGHEFDAEQRELAWDIAGVVAPAVGNAWLSEKAEASAVAEERNRLSREMHDGVGQTVSYLKLQSSMARELMDRGEIDRARGCVADMERTCEEIYGDLRKTLFCLRANVPSGLQFLPTLLAYLEEYRANYGLDFRLEVEDEGSSMMLSEKVGVQLSRIVLEALTNVHKHAKADSVRVCFARDGARLRVVIEDDGQGFDVVRAIQGGSAHFGLRIMQERAESVGGTLDFRSEVGRGTRIAILAPLA